MAYGAAVSTGELTSSKKILSTSGLLTSILVITDGTNAATVILYDGQGGKMLGKWGVAGATLYGGRNWIVPVQFDNGLYISISGTGASAIVEYI